jgi:hypothetical protein
VVVEVVVAEKVVVVKAEVVAVAAVKAMEEPRALPRL